MDALLFSEKGHRCQGVVTLLLNILTVLLLKAVLLPKNDSTKLFGKHANSLKST